MSRNNLPLSAALAFALVIAAAGLNAQEPGKTMPEGNAPAPALSKAPPVAPGQTPSAAYEKEHAHMLEVDFGQLTFYQAADESLPAPAPGENRVVFMGDSITHGWHLQDSFPGKPYINRGISGQTSPQMLVRFRQDVINLKPKVVIILAGTNDVAGNTGPMTPEDTENNIASMSDLARANHIRVVLCSITPAVDFPWAPGQQPAQKIVALNEIVALNDWIRRYAQQRGFPYVDYYSKLADAEGGLPGNLSHDGVHPNPAGYAIMAPMAEAGIEKALKTRE